MSEVSSHDHHVTHAPVQSSTTGCYISAPMSPPVGYPMPQIGVHPPRLEIDHHHHHEPHTTHHHPVDPRASVISSLSSGSRSSGGGEKPGSVKSLGPPAPRWAQPPGKTPPTASFRATSFDSGLDRSDVNKINPETILDPAGEWVEVLKGEQGRIAIKSTPTQYEVMVWLPGFR